MFRLAFGRWRKARDNYDKKLLEESEMVDTTVDSRQRRHLATGIDNTTMKTTTSSTSNNQQYVSSVERSGIGGVAAGRHRYS